ncbi:RepB family plasmid replication initiator protein, partial [Campylobacter sp. CS_ED1]|nr:RepB family plasmid replication initiator protein [Campylobacter sp. CS_ED1]
AKNALQIRFTSEVLPYFTRLASGNFTTYQLKDLFALDSVTSMSLYSYFIKNEFKYANQDTYEVELSLENIKALTDIGEKKYDRWVDFRRYVLDKIVEEINDRTSLKLEYDTIKKGRPIVGVRFKITSGHIEAVIPQSNENTQIYLDVDFDDNAIVKELGAKFDMTVRSWYIHANDPNYKQFSKWFKSEGCLTDSQANLIVNDIMFQMDFAVAGVSMNDFKKEMKYKLKNDPAFVQGNRERLNEIFGKEII